MAPETFPSLQRSPGLLVGGVLATDRRVLLFGAPGLGKSTLAGGLARALAGAGRAVWCIGADPGSPAFGVPGAVCLGEWRGDGWHVVHVEALCALDAGRFRLPLVAALGRLAEQVPAGMLLIDGPGVVRGVAGAELLSGVVAATRADVVLVLAREGEAPPLPAELTALAAEIYVLPAASQAERPGKRSRARHRTCLWDAYLQGAEERRIALAGVQLIGTPPPADVPAAWTGRQVALQDRHGATVALGEVVSKEADGLRVRMTPGPATGHVLLVRDAQRSPDGLLGVAGPGAAATIQYAPPPDMVPRQGSGSGGGPRPVARVGPATVTLLNGVFGDPLLHLRLRHERRSLLFDLGEAGRLAGRIAHQVSDVLISHAHVDHIGGFLWLLRSRIGELPVCRMFGPPGLAENILGLVRGILWDRIGDRGPRFEVAELHGHRLARFRIQAGRPEAEPLGEQTVEDGVLLDEPAFRLRGVTLDHGTPVLAFAFEPARQLNVRKERLGAMGLPPGPWLGELKRRIFAEDLAAPIRLPDGRTEPAGALAGDLVIVTPGQKLVYATDLADTPENRGRLVALARGAHTFFCEAAFAAADSEQALHTQHLTARACGEIATAAGVERLVPFHFSRRYEEEPERVYDEVRGACSRAVLPRGELARDCRPIDKSTSEKRMSAQCPIKPRNGS